MIIRTSFRYMSTRYSHKSYKETLQLLESLINPPTSSVSSNENTINQNASKQSLNLSAMHSYVETLKIPYESISYIHVAGTKGKGSTCTFSESILRNEGYKTGLYTSPHLIDIRERIRINGEPVSKEIFIDTVWDLLTRLEKAELFPSMTTYFRFLTLVAIQIFLNEKVDVAIMECGLGGRLDATNIIKPEVCGLTSIGYDHCSILGNTLESIAFEKAGIIKENVPVVSQPQGDNVLNIFNNQALEKNAPFFLSSDLSDFELLNNKKINLGMHGSHQRANASLALSLTNIWKERYKYFNRKNFISKENESNLLIDSNLSQTINNQMVYLKNTDKINSWSILKPFPLSDEIISGLETCRFAGRSHCISFPEQKLTFYLDGAHTAESIELALEWFLDASSNSNNESFWISDISSDDDLEEIVKINDLSSETLEKESNENEPLRYLVFNFTGGRDAQNLLHPLLKKKEFFTQSHFVPTDSSHFSFSKVSELFKQQQKQLESIQQIWGESESTIQYSINNTLKYFFKPPYKREKHIFVTGSLYLVGDFLRKLSRIKNTSQTQKSSF